MKKLILGAVTAALLTGCNASKNVLYMQDVALDTPVAVQQGSQIKVRPGDMLSITVTCKEPSLAAVFNAYEYSMTQTKSTIGNSNNANLIGARSGANGQNGTMPYIVDDAGNIDFPVLGELHVAGLSRQEIAKMIKQRIIAGNYIPDPKVNVTFMNLHYSVLGEVGSPGIYYISDDKVTLLDALANAGDLSIYGKRDAVYVTRTENGQRTTHKVDLRGTDFYNSPVYYLQQDDVIYVEPNDVRAGQSAINENSFKSVGMWMSIASFLMSLSVFLFK